MILTTSRKAPKAPNSPAQRQLAQLAHVKAPHTPSSLTEPSTSGAGFPPSGDRLSAEPSIIAAIPDTSRRASDAESDVLALQQPPERPGRERRG